MSTIKVLIHDRIRSSRTDSLCGALFHHRRAHSSPGRPIKFDVQAIEPTEHVGNTYCPLQ